MESAIVSEIGILEGSIELVFRPSLDELVDDNEDNVPMLRLYLTSISFCRKDIETARAFHIVR